jgi:hypothetical protein
MLLFYDSMSFTSKGVAMQFTVINLTLVSGETDAQYCRTGWGVACNLTSGVGCSALWGGPIPCDDPYNIGLWCDSGTDWS